MSDEDSLMTMGIEPLIEQFLSILQKERGKEKVIQQIWFQFY